MVEQLICNQPVPGSSPGAGSISYMPGYVYILESLKSVHRYYMGSTNNPICRLIQHNANAVRATQCKGPWKIIKLLEFPDLRRARQVEYYLKRQKDKRIIELVLADRGWIVGRASLMSMGGLTATGD